MLPLYPDDAALSGPMEYRERVPETTTDHLGRLRDLGREGTVVSLGPVGSWFWRDPANRTPLTHVR